MEAIRTYLESMFAHLPGTPEVIRAKTELGQMMEDKYNELIEEGKSENEAVGIVISEFGNLDEIAEELGIGSFVEQEPVEPQERVISFEEIRDFLKSHMRLAYMSAFGVFFLIVSSVPIMILTGLSNAINMGDGLTKFFFVIGLILLFLLLAGGLGMLIFSGMQGREFSYIWKENGRLEYSAQEYVRSQFAERRTVQTILLVVGIVLCLLSALPAAVLMYIDNTNFFFVSLSGAIALFLIGVAVFLFVLAGRQRGSLNRLQKVRSKKMTGSQSAEADGRAYEGEPVTGETILYENEILSKFMPVYWPTITAFYLIVSFLTFRWGTTWIIWPIAGIVHAFISRTFGRHVYES